MGDAVTLVLRGDDLGLAGLVRVAREAERVELHADAVARMRATHGVVERALEREDAVYGLTTGVGAAKRYRVEPDEQRHFNRMMVLSCAVGQGADAPEEVVRGTLLLLVNGFARGTAGVRPELAQRLVEALNQGAHPRVRMLGSVGMADLIPLGDLAAELLEDFPLAPKEGLSLISSSAFSTALAALALADYERLLDAVDAAAALDLEAFAANLTMLHPAVAETRPYAGIALTLDRLRALLRESGLWQRGAARALQDPLTFRCVPQVHGAARDTLAFAQRQLAIELNASQENPIVLPDEDRLISVGNSDTLPLAASLDFLRIALAPVLTSAAERLDKLLEAPFSGLPQNLAAHAGGVDIALSELAVLAQALTAEARLLAQPVSFEVTTSSRDQGLTDRMTMAPLAARRVGQMVELGERLVAAELVVAAQALELRAPAATGLGTARLHALVRERVPFTGDGAPPPRELDGVLELIRSGALSELGAEPAKPQDGRVLEPAGNSLTARAAGARARG